MASVTVYVTMRNATSMEAIVGVPLDVKQLGLGMECVHGNVILQSVNKMEAIVQGIAHLDVNLGGQGMASVTRYVTMLTVTTMEEIVHHSFRRNKERVKQAFNK